MGEDEIYREFGRRVASRRLELRLTQGDLAALVKFSRASIANVEAGRQKLPLHQVYRLLAALQLADLSALLPAPPSQSVENQGEVVVAMRGEAKDLSPAARAQVEAIYREFSGNRE